MKIRYLVLVMRTPEFKPEFGPAHKAYLDALKAAGKLEMAGPFTDKSGGAYLITAENLTEAKAIAHNDPLYTSNSSDFTVYEWDTH
jgi:uncharacterized protein YciI